ncbi:hypothetical protein L8106_03387 [Lyngbya sp. PCC 8106]|nr:hypothetical protein L8106_03387 [Lyngbya sp. PCC 8106]
MQPTGNLLNNFWGTENLFFRCVGEQIAQPRTYPHKKQ